jgi:hypothetical protein
MNIDLAKEVQDFGPYKLVIRGPEGMKVQAVLWRGGEKLASGIADTREHARAEMLLALGIRQQVLAKERGDVLPSAEQVARAFRFLWPMLNDGQQTMLMALRERQQMSPNDIAEAAGYRTHSGVNLWLGFAGGLFNQECPRADMLVERGVLNLTSWFGTWDEVQRTWAIRPEVSQGMRLAGCIAT